MQNQKSKRRASRFFSLLLAVLTLAGTVLPVSAANEVITETRMLHAADFKAPRELSVEDIGGNGISISNNITWSGEKTYKYTLSGTFRVDVDKVPLITLTVQRTDIQYDIYYQAEDRVSHYVNKSRDESDWRRGPDVHTVNLRDRDGLTGVRNITVTIEYILWEIPSATEKGCCAVVFSGLGFMEEQHFTVGEYFRDNAVLQCDMPVTVSGKTDPGKTLTAKLFKENETSPAAEATARADDNGSFALILPAQKAGYDAYTLEISDGEKTKKVNNLVFGEVWLAGGQSNMQYKLCWTVDGHAMDPDLDFRDPYLRGLLVTGPDPVWTVGDSNSISNISAVGYYFAAELRKTLDVPVAVIDAAAGGTSIYHWIAKDVLKTDQKLYRFASSLLPVGELYDDRIERLAGTAVRGLLWYQGEANCGEPAGYYSAAMALLRKSWGDLFGWKDGTMPLIVSHLAPHYYADLGIDKPIAFTEELNAIVSASPGVTAQVAICDLPVTYQTEAPFAPVSPIHPSEKKGIGRRMGLSALAMLYGVGEETTSPVCKSMEIKDGAAYLTFDHVGDGLAAEGKELYGFAIRSGKVFVPAYAEIVGKDAVRVYSPLVKEPVAVTYAWSSMNQEANLVSTKNGSTLFAAVPFRTSDEKGVSYYRPHDWTYCDSGTLWHSDGTNAGFLPSWKSVSGQISFDTETVHRGEASLRLGYTADESGTVVVSPSVSGFGNGPDIDPDYSDFYTLRFFAKNGGEGNLKCKEIRFTASDGKIYSVSVNEEIASTDGWKAVYADLFENLTQNGEKAYRPKLKNVTAIDFVFEAAPGQSGVLYLDDILFSDESAENTEEPETDAATDPVTEPSGKNGFLVPALISGAAVALAAAASLLIIKKKKK
ncbi:MAG: sialate O-acetylesterase [Lachnospiraceae bacterium]|nr:sialate O-acetylesterase [Lachnospiraceae bacterium]